MSVFVLGVVVVIVIIITIMMMISVRDKLVKCIVIIWYFLVKCKVLRRNTFVN